MFKKSLQILLTLLFFLNDFPQIQAEQFLEEIKIVHTQDKKELRAEIIQAIEKAQESILIFTFTLSDSEIIQKLKDKAERGVVVTIVIDKDHRLPIASIPNLEILTRNYGEGRVHHKILVVDRQLTWIGSANFTTSAYDDQENLMIGIDHPQLALDLHQEADYFRGRIKRESHEPFVYSMKDQEVTLGLLPHDNYPLGKAEATINKLSKAALLSTIEQATSHIKIAMMVWTDMDLANAIKNAHYRGVKIDIVAPDLGGVLQEFLRVGINVVTNPSISFMHNKMMIVDDKILVNGSANWSKSSFTRNDESFVILQPLTEKQQDFLQLYWNYLYPID